MNMKKIEGLIAAAFTPFYEDGSLNLELIPSLVDKLVADGVKGIFVCGSNGEGPNMTSEERMKVAEAFVKAANRRLLIIVHVGHSSIAEAKVLAAHAAEIGADAFSSVAAFYFKPTTVENLANCMIEIAGAAPELPFYYYHIPMLTGVGMDMIEFLEYAGPRIPNLAGINILPIPCTNTRPV
jgi:N-acetylneuraminate lyase